MNARRIEFLIALFTALAIVGVASTSARGGEGAAEGSLPYAEFETTETCSDCHGSIGREHARSLMAQSFTHPWDEIEYFQLALPHALKEAKVAGVKAGCNGCHAPLAYLAGDIPPQPVAEGSRANEGVSCDVCHSITGFDGEVPFNFNYVMKTGDVQQGTRTGRVSEYHDVDVNPFLETADFCGICHNEQDPYGVWVKATHLEWQEGPYAEAGVTCQDCHMPPVDGENVEGGDMLEGVRRHTFHGVHSPEKVAGSVEVLLDPEDATLFMGATAKIRATVLNAKAGHMIPSGSVEERVVWMHVEATDAAGNTWHLPVDRKGFDGEDWTIADPAAVAYQDIGEIQGLADFTGLSRDGEVPAGDRIFRMPYLDPDGNMTISQWHTASLGVDYRLPPLEAIGETFTWELPENIAAGDVTVTATVYMTRVVSSVVDFMGIPEDEKQPMVMGRTEVTLQISG